MRKEPLILAGAAIAVAVASVAAGALATAGPARAAVTLYPDLRTVPPSELRFSTATIDGSTHTVLRFTNTVWNAGQGPLELVGNIGVNGSVTQRLYDDAGSFASVQVGDNFTFHPAHDHWHFDGFADYQLWTKPEYDAWVASGRSQGQARTLGSKTTFCLMDTSRVQSLPGSPSKAVYSACGRELQGISVGWSDSYRYTLADQWIDLGNAVLPDGDYVLRSVADPKNRLYESAGRSDAARESEVANEAITSFTVQRGRLKVTRR
jgi:hypothetical protein